MDIVVIDCDLESHAQLVDCVAQAYPNARLRAFTDPILALKHGIHHPIDALLIQPRMRLPIVGNVIRNLREYHPKMQVMMVAQTPCRRVTDFEEPPDAVLQMPITAGQLQAALSSLPLPLQMNEKENKQSGVKE